MSLSRCSPTPSRSVVTAGSLLLAVATACVDLPSKREEKSTSALAIPPPRPAASTPVAPREPAPNVPPAPAPSGAQPPPATTPPVDLTGAVPNPLCALDSVVGRTIAEVVEVPRSAPLHLLGWAADPETRTVPPTAFVELEGPTRHFSPIARRMERTDVAKVLETPAFVQAGFEAFANLAGVPPGTYRVKVHQVTAAGKTTTCDTTRRLDVR